MIAALSLLGSVLGSSATTASPSISATLTPAGGSADFGQVMADVSARAVNDLKSGEATAISALQGKASVQQVVESVMGAEQSLNTAIAIRDKVVSAYQSLSQMAI
ncbi:Flagellar hook-basal body complex protein FliE 2 [Methylocella tundrae]|uniref:Flagellar hook-basal body complex protein FliE n=1 Tax=Methylocella tundrae TaxID=227605 RepID=A0A4U8YZW7_METTU|nr:flagellar hook-basal body complex protein FliE [Methylocella tundrae]WPP04724.1 flagellar hook-basal body complex protein FliE [Methylocella tundrae]VFU06922.1 Flagellar hook-basal body complex protein FliE 2 [Methylocella tundrae]VTZ24662.1 Flagellar hook-basal body complex protein FliE 2 [Methylocella tundrae]VTZ50031.1 Flagellar hook-basal body complex protein FliE 2 [Methylocella tundrae]